MLSASIELQTIVLDTEIRPVTKTIRVRGKT